MSKRYILKPPPVKIVNPETDDPVIDPKTGVQAEGDFDMAVRHLCSEMLKTKALDVLDIIELRLALTRAEVGEEVGIEEAWWEKLVEAFKRPDGFTVMYLASSKPHILAVNEATTEPRRAT